MTPLEFIGAISMGALAVLLLAFGWAAWIFRGHRGDLSGLAIRREWWHRTETPPEPYTLKLGSYPTLVGPPQYHREPGDARPLDRDELLRHGFRDARQHGARTEAREDDG